MPLSQHPLYLALFAVVLLAGSGLGRLALGPAAACGALRTTIAHGVLGLLLLSAGFSLALLLNVPFDVAGLVASLLGVLGLAAWAVDFVRGRAARRAKLGVWLAGMGALLAVSWLPVDANATDAVTYAFLASTALHGPWVSAALAGSPLADLAGTNLFWGGSRGAAIALLWPSSALGWGIGGATVAEVAQWLVLLSLLLLIDVLAGARCQRVPCILLAAGGLGAFSEDAALGGGQIGQAFGTMAVLAALWLDRYLLAGWARLLALGLVGYVVATGYTEFLAALPLYVGCLFLLQPRERRSVVAACAAVVAGVVLAELLSRGVLLDYLLNQVRVSPQARAFSEDPHTPLDVWQWVLLQRPFSRWLLVLLVPASAYIAWMARGLGTPRRRLSVLDGAIVVGALATLGLLTWVTLRTDNANYATFKMSGWVGPALLAGGWALAGCLRGRAQQLVAGGLLLLASYRTLGFVWSAAALTVTNLPTQGLPASWYLTGAEASCAVQLIRPQPTVMAIEVAIAESAAPRRGCSLEQPGP